MVDKLIIGCGYLGRRVAAAWVARGHRVFGTTRTVEGFGELRQLGVEPLQADVLDPKSLHSLPAVETVLHCVGLDRKAGVSRRSVYVDGLANVLDAIVAPKRFLYVSSTSVYGQTQGEEVDETAATEPADDAGRVMLAAEQALRQRVPDAVILRFTAIYGPGRFLRAQAVRAGEVLPVDPNSWLNLIHVDDGVQAVVAAEEHGKPGETYNVNDGHPVRRGEFYTTLAARLGAPQPRFAPPAVTADSNRRIVNRRLLEELEVRLQYPRYELGLNP
jgi:nucleoside-diphosphate-sugar epimerase